MKKIPDMDKCPLNESAKFRWCISGYRLKKYEAKIKKDCKDKLPGD